MKWLIFIGFFHIISASHDEINHCLDACKNGDLKYFNALLNRIFIVEMNSMDRVTQSLCLMQFAMKLKYIQLIVPFFVFLVFQQYSLFNYYINLIQCLNIELEFEQLTLNQCLDVAQSSLSNSRKIERELKEIICYGYGICERICNGDQIDWLNIKCVELNRIDSLKVICNHPKDKNIFIDALNFRLSEDSENISSVLNSTVVIVDLKVNMGKLSALLNDNYFAIKSSI